MEKIAGLGNHLLGEPREALGFIVELNQQGEIIRCVGEMANLDFLELDQQYDSYLLFDVLDHGEYIYFKWQNISQAHFEKLLEITFAEEDFIGHKDKRSISYPPSHSVMF